MESDDDQERVGRSQRGVDHEFVRPADEVDDAIVRRDHPVGIVDVQACGLLIAGDAHRAVRAAAGAPARLAEEDLP
jgi:hypothetical protein